MHEKVALERSSKSTKYEIESYYGDLVHEQFSFLKTAKLQRECNEDDDADADADADDDDDDSDDDFDDDDDDYIF